MRLGPFGFTFQRQQERASVREMGNVRGIQSVGDLLFQIEALTNGESTNRYLSRRAQVTETIRKYRGASARGNLLLRNILETRSTFAVGRGLTITGVTEDSAEMAFIKAFFRRNRFNLAFMRALGRERCIEGQCLLALNPGGADHLPLIRYISWYDTNYEVRSSAVDYAAIDLIQWEGSTQTHVIPPGQAAFFKFHARITDTHGTPLFAGVLSALEDLDSAMGLLQVINKVSAKPTPYFQFQPGQENDAEAFEKKLTATGWQMGMPLAGSAVASMLQLGYGSYSSLENQIHLLVKMISGSTAVPTHYFGFPDLLANRSVADDISAMYVQVSETEIDQWTTGFTDLVGRAMAMYNNATGSQLETQAALIEVEQISKQAFQEVLQVWLPIWLGGGIDTITFLSKLPGLDEQKVAVAVKAELDARGGLTPGQVMPPERVQAMATYRAFSQLVM